MDNSPVGRILFPHVNNPITPRNSNSEKDKDKSLDHQMGDANTTGPAQKRGSDEEFMNPSITITSEFVDISIKIKEGNQRFSQAAHLPSAENQGSKDLQEMPTFYDGSRSNGQELEICSVTSAATGANYVFKTTSNLQSKNVELTTSSLRDQEVVANSSVLQSRLDSLRKFTPQEVAEKVLRCNVCGPGIFVNNLMEANGHQQNVHGLKYCSVCFELINCHEDFMQDHLSRFHYFFHKGKADFVHCPICLTEISYPNCLDHISKRHVKTLQEFNCFGINQEVEQIIVKPEIPMPCLSETEENRGISVKEEPVDTTVIKSEPYSPLKTINRVQLEKYIRKMKQTMAVPAFDSNLAKDNENDTDTHKLEPSKVALEDFFLKNQNLSGLDALDLSNKSGLTVKQVRMWFQTQRHLCRRMESRINELPAEQKKKIFNTMKDYYSSEDKQSLIDVSDTIGFDIKRVAYWFYNHQSDDLFTTEPLNEVVDSDTDSGSCKNLEGQMISEPSMNANDELGRNAQNYVAEWLQNSIFGTELDDSIVQQDLGATKNSQELIRRWNMFPKPTRIVLFTVWNRNQYPSREEYSELIEASGLSDHQVKNWFQNQRTKLRAVLKDLHCKAIPPGRRKILLAKTLQRENIDLIEENIAKTLETARTTSSPCRRDGEEFLLRSFNNNPQPSDMDLSEIAKGVRSQVWKIKKWFVERFLKLKRGKLPGYDYKGGTVVKTGTTYTPVVPKDEVASPSFVSCTIANTSAIKPPVSGVHMNPVVRMKKLDDAIISSLLGPRKTFTISQRPILTPDGLSNGVESISVLTMEKSQGMGLKRRSSTIERPADEVKRLRVYPPAGATAKPSAAVDCVSKIYFSARKDDNKSGKGLGSASPFPTSSFPTDLKSGETIADKIFSSVHAALPLGRTKSKLGSVNVRLRSGKLRTSVIQPAIKGLKKRASNKDASSPPSLSKQGYEGETHLNQRSMRTSASSPRGTRNSKKSSAVRYVGKGNSFTDAETYPLYEVFNTNKNRRPNRAQIKLLERKTGLSYLQIRNWFNCKRFTLRNSKKDPTSTDSVHAELKPIQQKHNANSHKVCVKDQKQTFSRGRPTKRGGYRMKATAERNRKDNENSIIVPPDIKDTNQVQNEDGARADLHITSPVPSSSDDSTGLCSEIAKISIADFGKQVATFSLNFEPFLKEYYSRCEVGKVILEHETKRLRELMEVRGIRFTLEQEDYLIERRLDTMNKLLKDRPRDKDWVWTVTKFHTDEIFSTWDQLAVFAGFNDITLEKAVEALYCGINIPEHEYFERPESHIPNLLKKCEQ